MHLYEFKSRKVVETGSGVSTIEPMVLCLATGTAFALLANKFKNGTFLYPLVKRRQNANANAIIQTALMLRQGGDAGGEAQFNIDRGAGFRSVRKAQNYSREELAQLLGIEIKKLEHFEQGILPITESDLIAQRLKDHYLDERITLDGKALDEF